MDNDERDDPETGHPDNDGEEEEDDDEDRMPIQRVRSGSPVLSGPKMSVWRRVGYAAGHSLNDATACTWFAYLLVFYERVVGLSAVHAGLLILIGQFVDAAATPVVGFVSDSLKLPDSVARYGRRLPVHLLGVVLVALSFPFVLNSCLACGSNSSDWIKVLWFTPAIAFFQIGWAATQVSHLALLGELSESSGVRVSLTALRSMSMVVASLSIHSALLLLLGSAGGERQLSSADLGLFRLVGVVAVGVGALASVYFYASMLRPVRECRPWRRLSSASVTSHQRREASWRAWFKRPEFYAIGALYMLSRLFCNITTVYLPFYVLDTCKQSKHVIALLPLTIGASGLVASWVLAIGAVSHRVSSRSLLAAACLLGGAASASFALKLTLIQLVVAVCVFGIASTCFIVASISAVSELIGARHHTSAFVFGVFGCLDKLANGAAVQIVQLLAPADCDDASESEQCATFFRLVVSILPAASLVLLVVLQVGLAVKARRNLIPEPNDQVNDTATTIENQ